MTHSLAPRTRVGLLALAGVLALGNALFAQVPNAAAVVDQNLNLRFANGIAAVAAPRPPPALHSAV